MLESSTQTGSSTIQVSSMRWRDFFDDLIIDPYTSNTIRPEALIVDVHQGSLKNPALLQAKTAAVDTNFTPQSSTEYNVSESVIASRLAVKKRGRSKKSAAFSPQHTVSESQRGLGSEDTDSTSPNQMRSETSSHFIPEQSSNSELLAVDEYLLSEQLAATDVRLLDAASIVSSYLSYPRWPSLHSMDQQELRDPLQPLNDDIPCDIEVKSSSNNTQIDQSTNCIDMKNSRLSFLTRSALSTSFQQSRVFADGSSVDDYLRNTSSTTLVDDNNVKNQSDVRISSFDDKSPIKYDKATIMPVGFDQSEILHRMNSASLPLKTLLGGPDGDLFFTRPGSQSLSSPVSCHHCLQVVYSHSLRAHLYRCPLSWPLLRSLSRLSTFPFSPPSATPSGSYEALCLAWPPLSQATLSADSSTKRPNSHDKNLHPFFSFIYGEDFSSEFVHFEDDDDCEDEDGESDGLESDDEPRHDNVSKPRCNISNNTLPIGKDIFKERHTLSVKSSAAVSQVCESVETEGENLQKAIDLLSTSLSSSIETHSAPPLPFKRRRQADDISTEDIASSTTTPLAAKSTDVPSLSTVASTQLLKKGKARK